MRRKPYSVILLDEVEKAHPDVFNILLQVLDDGRLTDGQGRTVDFKNCVIIMTSNLGSQSIQDSSNDQDDDAHYQAMKDKVMESVTTHFRPEFVNRVDDIVVFHALGKEQVRAIADIQIDILRKRLANQDIELTVSKAALDVIGEAGFDPVYGARPLKRSIQSLVENQLAHLILSGTYVTGDTVLVDVEDGQLSFTKKE